MFTVRNRISLKAKAARAWAAVRQLPAWLLRGWEERLASLVAVKGGAFEDTFNRPARIVNGKKTTRNTDKHPQTIMLLDTSRTRTFTH